MDRQIAIFFGRRTKIALEKQADLRYIATLPRLVCWVGGAAIGFAVPANCRCVCFFRDRKKVISWWTPWGGIAM